MFSAKMGNCKVGFIAFLRFPLYSGVVFIHNYRPSIIVGNEVMGSETYMPTYSFIGQLFSQYIGLDFSAFVFLLFRFSLSTKLDYSLQNIHLQDKT